LALPGYRDAMAIIRTVDKKKIEIEVGGGKLEEEISHVAASEVPMVKLKRAGKDEFVWVNARHIVSFEEDPD
jgi:hypothetical protein